MPKAKRSVKKQPARRSAKFVCPDCGFKAAHAMGLGRHRTARHGALSQRELKDRASASGVGRRELARVEKRLSELERKHDALLRTLRRAFGQASRTR